jgi:XTP/dITP diphosphohydrolase
MDTKEHEFTKNLFKLANFSLFVPINVDYWVNPESYATRMQLIVATRNAHKTREIRQILGSKVDVRDLTEHPEISEITESGTSFEENAKLKAIAVSQKLPGLVIADDSGLEVEALHGAPGIHSSRYAGVNASDKEKIAKLLAELTKINAQSDRRRARFRCLVAVACDGQVLATFEGAVEGTIAKRPRGSHGFGYDPIFIPDGFEETFAELPREVKNNIGHRAKAIRKLQARLATLRREV